MDEVQLIEEALRGKTTAERSLYESHVDRIYRLAYRMSGDATIAEDLTQDTFVRAFDRLADFRQEASFGTWLHTIAISAILNGLKRSRRIRERERATPDLAAIERGHPPTDAPLRIRITDAIDGLSETLRPVFVMHDIEGYRHEEIAQILDVPVGTSKARLSRARERLRGMLRMSEVRSIGPEAR